MGHQLSSAVELIQVQRAGNKFFRMGVADMQGWRVGHEDGHDICLESTLGSFWVLDGHGGASCAQHCAPKLAKDFGQTPMPSDERILSGFSSMDVDFRSVVQENPDKESGSTVIGCIVQRQDDGCYTVKMANCGDSRGLIVFGPDAPEDCSPLEVMLPQHLVNLGSKNIAAPGNAPDFEEPNKDGNWRFGCRWPVICESVDHKPNHPTENQRILIAGGFVSPADNGPARLDGNLAVSRGLGDFEYKSDKTRSVGEQKASSVPDIYEVNNIPAGSFIVLACDGLWDVCTGEYIARYVHGELKKNANHDIGEMAAHLIKWSLEKGTKDNVTIMIIQLTDGSEWESVPDEMKGFEKLLEPARDASQCLLEEDARKQYITFLSRCSFSDKPCPCTLCGTWLREMWQCPCKTVFYCCRRCQKKGWKTHKDNCPLLAKQPELQ